MSICNCLPKHRIFFPFVELFEGFQLLRGQRVLAGALVRLCQAVMRLRQIRLQLYGAPQFRNRFLVSPRRACNDGAVAGCARTGATGPANSSSGWLGICHMRILSCWLGIIFAVPAAASAQVTVPMSQYDYGRTGANLQEWMLNPSNVDATHFGKLFSRRVDDSIYALPLIVPNLEISGQRRNVLFVATMGNTVYAFDADDPAQSEPSLVAQPWHSRSRRQLDRAGPSRHSRNALYRCANGHALCGRLGAERQRTQPVGECAGHLQRQPEIQLATTPVVPLRWTGGNAHERERRTATGGAADGQRCAVYRRREHRARSERPALVAGRLRADIQCARSDATAWPSSRRRRVAGKAESGREAVGSRPTVCGNIYLSTAGGYYDGVSNFGSSTLKFAGPSLKLADWFTPDNHEFLFLQNIDMSAGGVTLDPQFAAHVLRRQGRRHFPPESQ